MKITSQLLSIPPYISTAWKNIASLHVENLDADLTLVVTLHSGARVAVPGLNSSILELVFAAHTQYLEQEEKISQPQSLSKPPLNFPMGSTQLISLELPFKNALMEMEGFNGLIEHNSELANSPDLPPDVLEKITLFSKTMGIEDVDNVPKPEPHCNCIRCQIAKAMRTGLEGSSNQENNKETEEEEIVKDEELTFKTWDITKSHDNLYTVTNPLDDKESYHVYLSEPAGCTCGEKHCEHIKAVLQS
jgi:hypothetical protein